MKKIDASEEDWYERKIIKKTEEEVSREKAQRRKIQRELEDLMQDNEAKDREITNLKNKLR